MGTIITASDGDVTSVTARVLADALVPTDFPAFRYASLPLALIDAIFSISVTYKTCQNVVERFNRHAGWGEMYAHERDQRGAGTHSISQLKSVLDQRDDDANAEQVFGNRQRTSTSNGILKAEAVRRAAEVLASHGVQTFTDAHPNGLARAERDYRLIPGQPSGVSFSYLKMLAGDDGIVKPDRMVIRYLDDALKRRVGPDEAQGLLHAVAKRLSAVDAGWNPRLLDGAIWQHESDKVNRRGAKPCAG